MGETNTDVSADKAPLLLTGNTLAATVKTNVRDAIEGILEYGPGDIRCGSDAEVLLYDIAVRVNRGLLDPSRPLMRTWETGIARHAPAAKVIEDFQRFSGELAERWHESFSDPISFAAWVERRSNANGHHLTDGCGRFARALAIAALSRQEFIYPAFQDRHEYFEYIEGPEAEWEQAYTSRIGKASEVNWLELRAPSTRVRSSRFVFAHESEPTPEARSAFQNQAAEE
jgi:hypothetical protein